MPQQSGMVYLVGAGPGDPGMITVRGLELLRQADVVIHDRLVPKELLAEVRRDARLFDVGKASGQHKSSQEDINAALIEHARTGCLVVRLKGGDPFIYGRGWEEMLACQQAGIGCVVVPGLSSALAVPAAAGIPLTLRGVARTVGIAAAQAVANGETPDLDFAALAGLDTIVILMGRANLREVLAGLAKAGRDPRTTVACIQEGTTRNQRVLVATLDSAADRADQHEFAAPLVTVVGEVARCAALGNPCKAGSLAGRRIVVTRPSATAEHLRRQLASLGAIVVDYPVIDIDFPDACPDLDDAIRTLDRFDWIAFTSNHGVEGFWRRLDRLGLDARALHNKKAAVIGARTAQAIRIHGIRPDVQSSMGTAGSLVEALRPFLGASSTILLPRSDIAGVELPSGLRACGAQVVEAIAYHTVGRQPPAQARRELERGVDAILLYSPSAVRRFVDLGLSPLGGMLACIGPTTAEAARQAGLKVGLVAVTHDDAGMITALRQYFDRVP